MRTTSPVSCGRRTLAAERHGSSRTSTLNSPRANSMIVLEVEQLKLRATLDLSRERGGAARCPDRASQWRDLPSNPRLRESMGSACRTSTRSPNTRQRAPIFAREKKTPEEKSVQTRWARRVPGAAQLFIGASKHSPSPARLRLRLRLPASASPPPPLLPPQAQCLTTLMTTR